MEMKWFLNNRSIAEYSGISSSRFGKRNLLLNIESITAEHSGDFKCEVSNKAGSVSYTADLKVYGIQKFVLK